MSTTAVTGPQIVFTLVNGGLNIQHNLPDNREALRFAVSAVEVLREQAYASPKPEENRILVPKVQVQ